MGTVTVEQVDQSLRDFIALARIAHGTADQLGDDILIKHSLYSALYEAFKVLDLREPVGERLYASVPGVHDVLHQGVDNSGVPWMWILRQLGMVSS